MALQLWPAVALLLLVLAAPVMSTFENYPEVDCEAPFMYDLYSQIDRDLAPWKERGLQETNRELVEDMCFKNGARAYFTCVLISKGKVYVTSAPWRAKARQGGYILLYFGFLIELYEASIKHELPDAQFALYTADPPGIELGRYAPDRPPPLVFAYSKAAGYGEVLIPFSGHFRCGTNAFDEMWQKRENLSGVPWDKRKPVALGRYTPFCPAWSPVLNKTGKQAPCARRHLPGLSYNNPDLLDIYAEGHPCKVHCQPIGIGAHADFKYLVSTDGWTASSKLEKYFLLKSTVMMAKSPLYAYFYHLLKPKVHIMPFMEEHEDDILDAVKWLQQHDDEAKKMGEEAYKFANKYLTRNARLCYWKKLISEANKLLKYEITCEQHEFCRPLDVELRHMLPHVRQHCQAGLVGYNGLCGAAPVIGQ